MPEENLSIYLVNTDDNYLMMLIIQQEIVVKIGNIKWHKSRMLSLTSVNLN